VSYQLVKFVVEQALKLYNLNENVIDIADSLRLSYVFGFLPIC